MLRAHIRLSSRWLEGRFLVDAGLQIFPETPAGFLDVTAVHADQVDMQRKKIGKDRIQTFLEEHWQLPLPEQKEQLAYILAQHMQGAEQRDDILWVGLKL